MRLQRKPSASQAFEATATGAKTGQVIQLRTDGDLLELGFRISGTIGVATAAATAYAGNGLKILNLLKNMSLSGDGTEKFWENVDLAQLVRRAHALTGKNPIISNITALSIASYAVDLFVRVPFFPQNWRDAPHPEELSYALPAWKYDKLELRYDERPLNEVLTPDTTTVLSESLTCQVHQLVRSEFDRAAPIRCPRLLGDTVALTATGEGQKLDVKGNYVLRSLYVDAFDNTVPDDDIVGNLKLEIERDGTIDKVNDDWETLQALQDAKSGAAHFTGGLMIMLDEGRGYGTEILAGSSSAKLIPNVVVSPTSVAELKVIKEVMNI